MSDIAIIFGAGSKVGAFVAKKLLTNKYKVLTVSRSPSIDLGSANSDQHHHFQGDLVNLETVPNAFAKTRELFGEPRVIIYNAAAAKFTKPEDVFNIDVESFHDHQIVNVTSVLLAIKESIKTFEKIQESSKPKTFIFTGNIQNVAPFPAIYSVGVGKAGTYSTLSVANKVFGEKYGYRFYYADERTTKGGAVTDGTSGEAAAEFYFDLAENTNSDIPVEATFIKGKGYHNFHDELK